MIKKYLFISLVLLFASTSVFYTIEAVTGSAEVASLRKAGQNLSKQKTVLEETFVKTLSLNGLEKKSVELGFSKPQDALYVLGGGHVTASLNLR